MKNSDRQKDKKLETPFAATRVWIELLLFFGVTAFLSLLASWQQYPEEQTFSIFTNTISHLGSPDAHRNPNGYSFFRLGFGCICLLMLCSVLHRHHRMHCFASRRLEKNTRLYLCGILCLGLTIFIPDSRNLLFAFLRLQIVHGAMVVACIVFFSLAILSDALVLRKLEQNVRIKSKHLFHSLSSPLLPFAILIFLFVVGLSCLGIWELRCAFDQSLPHWPGQGIFSMPLWEWIIFSYLLVFMCWFPQRIPRRDLI